jgi:translation initiation factor 1 (eIF-1/SUI1)
MIVAAIRHPVQDYATWKAAYDTMPPTSRGAKFARVNRAVDDPNMVTVVSGFDTVEEAQAFLGSGELKAKMAEAGVVGEPRIEIYQEVEVI